MQESSSRFSGRTSGLLAASVERQKRDAGATWIGATGLHHLRPLGAHGYLVLSHTGYLEQVSANAGAAMLLALFVAHFRMSNTPSQ
jgi:hypothetical protein